MTPYDNPSSNYGLGGMFSRMRPGVAFVVMIFGALIAFEIFNFSTTEHALTDLLGEINFVGLPWSTVLALAFCGIDFAGIARLFTPEQGADEPKEVWYLFGAWLLAATMNAILTWWGVSVAITNNAVKTTSAMDPAMVAGVVPVFVAVMVWVIRILIIGTLSMSIDRLLHPGSHEKTFFENTVEHSQPIRTNTVASRHVQQPYNPPANVSQGLGGFGTQPRPSMSRAASARPSTHNEAPAGDEGGSQRSYHSLSASARRGNAEGSGAGSGEYTGQHRVRRS